MECCVIFVLSEPIAHQDGIIAAHEYTSKKALVELLKSKIQTNQKQALKALVRVYENQSSDEKSYKASLYKDGFGFTKLDADFGTSLAEQFLDRGILSEKQMQSVRKLMPKYAKQLVEQSIREGHIQYDETRRIYFW